MEHCSPQHLNWGSFNQLGWRSFPCNTPQYVSLLQSELLPANFRAAISSSSLLAELSRCFILIMKTENPFNECAVK